MIVLLGSYRRYYGLNGLFKTAIKPQYQAFAEKYWSDYSLEGEIAKSIPPAGEFLVDGFFDRFTSDTNSALQRRLGAQRNVSALAESVEAGMLGINNFFVSVPESPFGGVKESGHGSEGGIEGLDAYLSTKLVSQM